MDVCGTRIVRQAADVHGDTVHHWKAGQIPTLRAFRLAQNGGWSLVALLLLDFTMPLVDEAPAGEGNTARGPRIDDVAVFKRAVIDAINGPSFEQPLTAEDLAHRTSQWPYELRQLCPGLSQMLISRYSGVK